MVVKQDQQRVITLLTDAIIILCKNRLSYKSEFCIEGLLGITLDNQDVVLVNIKETVKSVNQNASPNSRDPLAPLDLMVFNSVSLNDVQSTIGEDLSMKNTSLTSTPGKKHNTSICSYLDKLDAGCDAGMKTDNSLNFALNYALYDDVIEDLSMASGRRFQGLSMDDLAVFDNDMGDIMEKSEMDKEVVPVNTNIQPQTAVADKVVSMKNEALNCFANIEPMDQAQTLDLSMQECVITITTASHSEGVLSGGQSSEAIEMSQIVEKGLSGDSEMPLNLSEPKKKKSVKKKFPCSQCGKSYKTESSLNKHKCKAKQPVPSSNNTGQSETTQPLDLTVGRFDGEDEAFVLGDADIVDMTADFFNQQHSLSTDPMNNNIPDLVKHQSDANDPEQEDIAVPAPSNKNGPDMDDNDQNMFVCICNKSLPDYDAYLDHMALCAKSRQTPYKSCEVCGKYLFSSSGYVKHKRLHMGAYKFWCNVCQKGFFDRTHLNAHIDASHSKVRRYVCSICDKKFFWKHHLKRHLVSCDKAKLKAAQTSSKGSGRKRTFHSVNPDTMQGDDAVQDDQDAFVFTWAAE